MAPHLTVVDGRRRRDGHELLEFKCWVALDEPWVEEVEIYVRKFALSTTFKTLLFRDEHGNLAGVTAFDRQEVDIGRSRRAGWRLQVVALTPEWRGRDVASDIAGAPETLRASEYLFRKTYQRMLALDARRVIVIARVHDENRASIIASGRVGLERTVRESDDYWEMLGEVDPLFGLS